METMFRTGEKRENRLERGQLRILMTGEISENR
jgi:hypothetical protein